MVSIFARLKAGFSNPEYVFYFSLCFFVVSLYSPVSQVNNLAIVCMGLSWIYAGYYRNLKNVFKDRIAFGLLLFYVWQAITLIYSSNKSIGSMWLEYRSPMAYLPLLLCSAQISLSNQRKVLLLFAGCTAVAVVLGLAYSTYLVLSTGDAGYLYNDNLGILFDRQAVYFGMYVNFAIAVFVYFLHKGSVTQPALKRAIIFALILMTVFNYLLASRVSMVVLALFWLGYVVYLILKKKSYLNGLIVIFGMMILVVLATKMFPKTTYRFESVTNAGYSYTNLNEVDHFNGSISKEHWNSLNTRLAIWNCGKEVLRRNPLFGVGIGDVGDNMLEEYRKNSFYFGLKYNLNCHNQYLDAAVSYGLSGFSVFLLGVLVLPFYISIRQRNFLLIFFLSSLAIYLSTEVMFNRNQGVTFIVFFMVLLGNRTEWRERA